MVMLASNIAFCAISISILLCLLRLVRGPDSADRILAFDTLYINALALLIVLGIRQPGSLYFEAALLIALTGFIGTVALSRYLTRASVVES